MYKHEIGGPHGKRDVAQYPRHAIGLSAMRR